MPQEMAEEGAQGYQRHTAPALTTEVDLQAALPPKQNSTTTAPKRLAEQEAKRNPRHTAPTPTTEVDIEVAPRDELSPARRERRRVQDSEGAPRVRVLRSEERRGEGYNLQRNTPRAERRQPPQLVKLCLSWAPLPPTSPSMYWGEGLAASGVRRGLPPGKKEPLFQQP